MEGSNGNKIKLYERVATLEECQKNILAELNELKTNHLPHLQKGIDGIDEKFDRLTWFFVITIVGLGANIILGFIGK